MDEGAQVSVDGENIADNGTAMAQDGKIVFSAWAKDGYEITSVLVDGEKDARHNGDSTTEYVIEGIKTDETVVSVSTQALDTEASETGEDSAVKNVVTFQVAEGAAVTVDGEDVADNGTAMAKDGTIVFFAFPKDGYEITSVIFDGEHETRKTSDESGNEYIIEGIQTDETVVSVSAQPVDDGIRRNVVTFEVAKGAVVTVDGENVADGETAMAKDGTIIFTAVPEEGYEITSVIFDGDHETRKTSDESGNEYILEGIQTDETVISVSAKGPEAEETETETEPGAAKNEVSFNVEEGLTVTLNGEDVTNKTVETGKKKITFEVEPEEGYEIGEVIAEADGEEAEVTENGNGKYTIKGLAATNETLVKIASEPSGIAPISISGPTAVEVGETITLESSENNGDNHQWTSDDKNIATVEGKKSTSGGFLGLGGTTIYTGEVTGIAPGVVKITHTYTTGFENNQQTHTETYEVTVKAASLRTVTFNHNTEDNGYGSGNAPASRSVKKGGTITLPDQDNMTARNGYVFVGWSTNNGAATALGDINKPENTAVYPAGSSYNVEKNITLYAIWAKQNEKATFYIRLDGKMPKEPGNYNISDYTSGIPVNGALKEGYFYFNSQGVDAQLNKEPTEEQIKAVIDNNSQINKTYRIGTDYVVWYVIKYQYNGLFSGWGWHVDGVLYTNEKVRLTYDENVSVGYSSYVQGIPMGQQYDKNTSVTVEGTPTWPGHTFQGWALDKEGPVKYHAGDQFTITEDTVLYAIWDEITTSVTVTKQWIDGNSSTRPGNIEVRLKQDERNYGDAVILNSENGWTYTWRNLPQTDETGEKHAYTVEETAVPGYKTTYGESQTSSNGNVSITVTNTRNDIDAKINVTGTKTWVDGGKTHDNATELTLTLSRTSAKAGSEAESVEATATWEGNKYTFKDVAKYDAEGYEYTYSVAETAIEGYDTTSAGNNFTNTMSNIGEKTSVTGTKTWVDGGRTHNNANEVKLTLSRTSAKAGSTAETVEATAEWDGNKYTFADVAKYDAEGYEYTYSVAEAKVEGYTTTSAGNNFTNTMDGIDTKINVSGTKTWVDGGKTHDNAKELTLTLSRTSAKAGSKAENVEATATWEGDTYTFSELPKYDAEGYEYTYSVAETEVEGYTTEQVGNNFTNTMDGIDAKIVVTGTKTWVDGGKEHNNADELELTLSRTSAKAGSEAETVEATATWEGDTYTFSGLPKYDAEGYEYTYSVAEAAIEGYTTDQDGNNFTNTVNTINDKIDVSGTKTWVDGGKAHDNATELTLTLSRTSAKAGSKAETVEATATWDGNTYTFADVAKYDAEGYEYTYSVAEAEVKGYTTTSDGNNFTNTMNNDEPAGNKTRGTVADEYKVTETLSDGSTRDLLKVGAEVTYTIEYYNHTNEAANVTITDTLPAGTELVKVSEGGNYSDGTVTWTISNVGPFKRGFVTVTIRITEEILNTPSANPEVTNEASIQVGDEDEIKVSSGTDYVAKPGLTSEKKLTNGMNKNGSERKFKAGETATFDIVVKNTGNTTQYGVVVTDTMAGAKIVARDGYTVNADGTATIEKIPVGKSVTVQAEYTVTQDDIDNQTKLTNTATVSGEGTTTGPDPEPIPTEERKLNFEIAKELVTWPTTYKAGEHVDYLIAVRNTGNTTLTINLADVMGETAYDLNAKGVQTNMNPYKGCTITESSEGSVKLEMQPGSAVTFQYSHRVTEQDILNGELKNIATATPEEETMAPKSAEVTVKFEKPNPHLTVEKKVTSTPKNGSTYALGETVEYEITVTNDGNLTISDVTVKDDLTGLEQKVGELKPGEPYKVTTSYTVTEEDIRKGSVTNVATADGTPPNGTKLEVTPSEAKVPTDPVIEKMTVKKEIVNGEHEFGLGEVIRYMVTIENEGNQTREIVADDTFSLEHANVYFANSATKYHKDEEGNLHIKIAPNSRVVVTYEHKVTAEDIEAGQWLKNTVTMREESGEEIGSDWKEAKLTRKIKDLSVVKTLTNSGSGKDGTFKAGETATFDITVTNKGNTIRRNIVIKETLAGAKIVEGTGYTINEEGSAVIDELAPEETVTVQAEYTVTQKDIDKGGPLSNNLSVEAEGEPDPNVPTEDIPLEPRNPEWSVEKTAINEGRGTAGGKFRYGETVQYQVVITNKGNTTLDGLKMNDALFGDEINVYGEGVTWKRNGNTLVLSGLAPEKTAVVTYSHTITEADIKNAAEAEGKVVNTVTTSMDRISEEAKAEVGVEGERRSLSAEKKLTNSGSGKNGRFKAGEKAEFDIVVRNTGNVTQGKVVVEEFLSGAVFVEGDGYRVENGKAIIEKLAPKAEVTIKAEYTVTQADIDNDEGLKNIAYVEGDEGTDPRPNPEVPVPKEDQNPDWSVEKTVVNEGTAGGNAFKVGEVIQYQIVVENTGNVTLNDLEVADAMFKDIHNVNVYGDVTHTWRGNTLIVNNLAPGKRAVVTYSYTVTEEDVLTGKVENTATVSEGEKSKSDDADANTEIAVKELSSTKKLTNKGTGKDGAFKAGETAEFDIVVTNDGNITQKNVIVAEALEGAVIKEGEGYSINGRGQAVIGELKPGKSVTVKAAYTVTQKDIDSKAELKNIAKVSGEGTTPDPEPVPIPKEEQNPDFEVTKIQMTRPSSYKLGEHVNYLLKVENTGNMTLNLNVSDILGNETVNLSVAEVQMNSIRSTFVGHSDSVVLIMPPGAIVTFQYSHTVTEEDILTLNGELVNTATAVFEDTKKQAEVKVGIETPNPHLTVEKKTTSRPKNGSTYALGEKIEYSITVKNDGNLTIKDVTVKDELVGKEWSAGTLTPGASQTFTAEYVVTEADIAKDPGFVTNEATADGKGPDEEHEPDVTPGKTTDPTDPVKKAVTVEKEIINSGNTFSAGEIIRYQVTVRNEGNQTRNLVLTDTFGLKNANVYFADLNVTYSMNEDGSLNLNLPGGTRAVVTYDYEVTMRDIELGPDLRNTAVVSDKDGEAGRDTATATIVDEVRELLLNKKLTNAGTGENGTFKAGEKAEFDITVTNNGNTVRNIEVKEKLEGAVIVEGEGYTVENNKAVIKGLAPGETVTVKAAYTLKQEDIDNNETGEFANIAAVNGENTPPAPIPTEPRNPGLSVTKTVTNAGTSDKTGEDGKKLFKAGDTVEFDVAVNNTGNTTQARRTVIVTEQMEGAKFVSDGSVLYSVLEDGKKAQINVDMVPGMPGMPIILKAVYTVTQEDIDEGRQLTNIVMADGDNGTNPDPRDEEKIPTEPKEPGLTAAKTLTNAGTGENGAFKAGETAAFDIEVTNTGNTTQKDVVVTEQLAGAVIVAGEGYTINEAGQAVIGTIAPEATVTVKATYEVKQADIDSENTLKNIAVISGGDPTEPVPNPEVEIPREPKNPGLTASKTVTNAPAGGFKAGETAKFDITVTNSGNTTQTDVVVEEQLAGAEIVEGKGYTINEAGQAVIAEMAPKAEVVVKAAYTVSQDDIDNDAELKNIALVKGDNGEDLDPTPEVEIPEEPKNPGLTAAKTLTNAGTGENGAFKAGDTAAFDITVTNSGNTTQTNVTISEQLADAVIVPGTGYTINEDGQAVIAEMAPGAVVVVKATYTVKQSDIDSVEELKNIAVVNGDNGEDPDPTPEVDIPEEDQRKGLSAVKTVTNIPESGFFRAGETAEFDIAVTNTGNTTQKDVIVTEQLEDAVIVAGEGYTVNDAGQAVIGTIAPKATVTVKATYEVKQSDIDSEGTLKNVAAIGGGDPTNPVPDPEVEIPKEPKEPGLTANKTVTNAPAGGFKAGETAKFDITVTNTGNTTQTDVVVAEQLAGAEIVEGEGYTINEDGQAVIAEMAPDAVVIVKAEYTVTQEDIDSDEELKNIVKVEPENGPDPEVTIPEEPKNPALSSAKTVTNKGTGENGAFKAGETAEFNITVKNTGNMTQTNVVVAEQLAGAAIVEGEGYTINEAGQAVIAEMAPDAAVVVKAAYEVTQEDIDSNAELTNIALVEGDNGTNPDPEPEITIPTEPKNGHVTITKTTTSTPANGEAYVLGETITYSITAENDGNLTLTDVVVTDELTGDSWTVGTLEPGETSEAFTASHVVTEADILAGSVVNVATATGTSPDPETPPTVVPGNTEDPTEPKDGHLTIAKTVTGTPENGEAYALGETITYSITATNDGNLTLTNVVVTDALTGDSWTIAGLAPGASESFTAEHVVTEADILAGSVVNVATATGTSPDPEEPDVPVIPGTEEIQTDPKEGHLTITKEAAGTPANGETYVLGETVTYNITAANDGNLTITDITVADELTGDEWTIESLAPGASESFTAAHVVTEADILAGSVVNVATATGTSPDPDEPDVPVDPGTEEVTTEPKDGHLTIAKATTSTPANGTAYELGETITYSITAVNDGNLTITDITVTDELTADSWTVESLAPGESQTFAASHVVTEADTLAGSVVNTAVAAGTSPDPEEPDVPVTPGETEDPVETPAPSLYVEKTAAQAEGGYALGGVVTYTIRVVNNGNTDVSGITVNDPLTGNTWTVDALAEGGEAAFTATHVVTEADILAGSVTNVATAAGTAPDGSTVESEDSATVITEESRGHITVAKTATSTPANGTAYTLGETVTYEITAANDGNLTITDITVTDELTGDSWTVESLAPGADQTFTTTHVVTEADISAGSVLNVATAAGTSPDPEEPEVPVTPGQEEVLTEDRNPAVAIDKAVTSTPAAASGRYAAGETVTYQVTVTNTGNLTLENLTLEDMITRPGGAQVVPEGIEEGLAGVESLAPGESAVVTYSYVVTEADLGGSLVNNAVVEGTPVIPDPTPETPELQPQDNDSETVLTEEPADSTITISKTNVDGLTGELLSLPGAQFYVALFADEQLTQRVSGVQTLAFGEDQATVSAAFEGLEPGTYYIAETDAEGNVLTGGEYDGGTFTPEYAGGQQVVITESGQSTAIAFQNLFAVLPEEGYSRMAELTVTKEVRDTSGAPMNSDETFYAGLFYDEACTIPAEGVSQQIIPFEMNGGSSASATAEVTILGDGSDTVLYVTEVTADGTPVKDAADFPYEVTVEGGKVTVNADSPEASARIINVAEEPGRSYYEAGDLTVTKEVRNAEGRLVNSDETFYAGIFSDSAYTTLADNVSQPVVELNMQGASKMSVSVEVSVADEESDTILYVTEVTEDGKPVSGSASFAYDVTVEGGTVVMNGNTLEGNVKIVNAEASAEEPGEPEEPGTEEPGTEEPGTEEPGTEESGTEEPGTEKPGTGDNGTDDGDNDRTGMSEAETEGSETVQSVRTGDETPVMTWMIIFLAAALAMFLTAVSCFRKRRSR